MLGIGSKITKLRKGKSLSQSDLAEKIGASRTMIGNYERNLNTPSIEMLVKIAQVFDVSIDYMIGQGSIAHYDKQTIKRIEDIEHLDKDIKEKLFFLIDNVVQNFKTKQAFAS